MTRATRVLVIGRQGQLARALGERVGHHASAELVFAGRPDLDLERIDETMALVRRLAPEVIINAAAYTAVDRAEDEAELARVVNAVAPQRLAAEAARLGARMIQISTDYVYDGLNRLPYVESDPTGPKSVYGRTKREGEEAVLREGADHVVIRTAWVYSPFGRNFVKTMLELASSRDTLTVVDDQRGSPTSAHDLADGLLAMIAHWQGGGGKRADARIYHLAGSGEASWKEFAETILRESRSVGGPWADVTGIASDQWPTKARRPANSVLDSSRFERDFGYRAPDWRRSVVPVVRRLAIEGL